MDRNPQKHGLINLLALVLLGAAGFAVATYGKTLAGTVAMVFPALGAFVAAVSWFQMRLEEQERLEKLEFDELTKSAATSALFNAGETEVFPAQRSREQFERFFVPAFAVLLFLLQAGGAIFLWHALRKTVPLPIDKSTSAVVLGLFAMLALLLFLLGKYSTSLARLQNLRLLRPGATYMLFSAYVCGAVALGIIPVYAGFPQVDVLLAYAFVALLGLTGVETLIVLTLEMYRPRVKGKVERPLYESRLVSLLGQPEGLITTAAQTLDYQFGFKVSETWAYRLFERWLPWLILAQLAVLLLSTTAVFIDPGEKAILEHFGKPVAVLNPGGHLKFPWPVDQVRRYPAEQIQSFNVGFKPDAAAAASKVVLWTVPHPGITEENFLVANRESAPAAGATNTAATRPPPVSLLTISIPIHFTITNLTSWVYVNEEPETLLEDIANREVVRYLVSVDLQEILSQGRAEATGILRDRIQAEADRHQLGAKIIFVGVLDIHPPTKVAPDYEKVVAVQHTKQAAILAAEADAIRTNLLAEAQAFRIRTEAESDRQRLESEALAQSALFTNQLQAYLVSPRIYRERAYLEMFTHSVTNARQYILLATNTQDVITLDLQEKFGKELLDSLDVPGPKTNSPPIKQP